MIHKIAWNNRQFRLKITFAQIVITYVLKLNKYGLILLIFISRIVFFSFEKPIDFVGEKKSSITLLLSSLS